MHFWRIFIAKAMLALCDRKFCQFLTITRIIWSMDFDDPQAINDSRVFDDQKENIAFDKAKAFCDKSMVSKVLLYKSSFSLCTYIRVWLK